MRESFGGFVIFYLNNRRCAVDMQTRRLTERKICFACGSVVLYFLFFKIFRLRRKILKKYSKVCNRSGGTCASGGAGAAGPRKTVLSGPLGRQSRPNGPDKTRLREGQRPSRPPPQSGYVKYCYFHCLRRNARVHSVITMYDIPTML